MSVVINTKKELFLGKRTFKSRKMNKTEFSQKVDELYEKLKEEYVDMNSAEDYDEYDETAAKLYVIDSLVEDLDDEDAIPDLLLYCKDRNDIIGSGICIMNWEELPGQLELQTTNNGFTYMSVFSSIGDDASNPLYNIIYFDENDNLRIFVPYCGNLVFVGANVQMCEFGGYAGEEIENLFNESGEDISDYDPVIFYKLYGKKYGIKGPKKEIETDEIDENLWFDMDLMLEDIVSNCILE